MTRKGEWIQAYTGRRFWPLDPRAEDVHILDIAHGLAKQCRYNGAVAQFYSVAQHSEIMSRHIHERHRLWALLHDASEAYISDIPRPVKACFSQIRAVERRIMNAVAMHFGLDTEMPESVHWLDQRMLTTEAAQLLTVGHAGWGDMAPALPIVIEPVGWQQALEIFLARFEEITKRNIAEVAA